MTVLRSGSATDVGRVRSSNQDLSLEQPDLFAVADGMGGHAGGEVAAQVAVEALREAFARQVTVDGLRRAVAEANQAVWRQSQLRSELRGMGTTLTALALVAGEGGREVIALANVGDSRAYVYSGERITQVTADHSLAEEKVRQGELTEAEAAVHPHRHILTRALGVAASVEVDLWELHLRSGDRVLLCSDGLSNEVEPDGLADVLGTVEDPTEAARRLVVAANAHGGNDNITAVVVDVLEGERAAGAAAGSAGIAAVAAGADAGAAADALPDAGLAAAPAAGEGPAEPATDVRHTTAVPAVVGGAAGDAGGGAGGAATAAVADRRPAPPAATPAVGAGPEAGTDGDAGPPAPPAAPGRRERRHQRRLAGIPRRVTVRVVLFALLLLVPVGAAYGFVRWYATDNWYVTVKGGHLVVYQGRPGGMLWFQPTLVDRTAVTTGEVLPVRLGALRHDVDEASLHDARGYVANLHQEYLAQQQIDRGVTASPAVTVPSTAPTTTTTAPAAPATTGQVAPTAAGGTG